MPIERTVSRTADRNDGVCGLVHGLTLQRIYAGIAALGIGISSVLGAHKMSAIQQAPVPVPAKPPEQIPILPRPIEQIPAPMFLAQPLQQGKQQSKHVFSVEEVKGHIDQLGSPVFAIRKATQQKLQEGIHGLASLHFLAQVSKGYLDIDLEIARRAAQVWQQNTLDLPERLYPFANTEDGDDRPWLDMVLVDDAKQLAEWVLGSCDADKGALIAEYLQRGHDSTLPLRDTKLWPGYRKAYMLCMQDVRGTLFESALLDTATVGEFQRRMEENMCYLRHVEQAAICNEEAFRKNGNYPPRSAQ